MDTPYKSIILATEIINRAENAQIEADFMVVMGDKWVNGQCEDDVNDKFPLFSQVMTDLEMEYDREDLMRTFELLINVGNKNAY